MTKICKDMPKYARKSEKSRKVKRLEQPENTGNMRKIKILFVCHGNICRSPMAEFILKDKVEKRGLTSRFEIASAATSTEEIWNGKGNPIYPPAQAELRRRGIGGQIDLPLRIRSRDPDRIADIRSIRTEKIVIMLIVFPGHLPGALAAKIRVRRPANPTPS